MILPAIVALSDQQIQEDKMSPRGRPSAQKLLCLVVFLGQIQNYMMRANLSLLIVAMTKTSSDSYDAAPTGANGTTASDNTDPSRRLDWDILDRGLVLSAFSYGYITTQVIGGRLAERFGIKVVYGMSIMGPGLLTLLSPVVAKASFTGFCVLRGLLGVLEGASFPSIFVMASRWAPPGEKNRFLARGMFGHCFGLVITYPLCGYVAHYLGWEAAFYIIGAITSAWFILWMLLAFDSPEEHPWIAPEEKERLLKKLQSKRQ